MTEANQVYMCQDSRVICFSTSTRKCAVLCNEGAGLQNLQFLGELQTTKLDLYVNSPACFLSPFFNNSHKKYIRLCFETTVWGLLRSWATLHELLSCMWAPFPALAISLRCIPSKGTDSPFSAVHTSTCLHHTSLLPSPSTRVQVMGSQDPSPLHHKALTTWRIGCGMHWEEIHKTIHLPYLGKTVKQLVIVQAVRTEVFWPEMGLIYILVTIA